MAIPTTDTPDPDDIHEGRYADLLPDMDESEFERLKTSMEQHGFDETTPIIVTTDGEIVDGHHRYRAAQAVGVEPAVRVTDDVGVEQAIRTNLARRDHDSGDKREIVVGWLLSDRHTGDRSQREVAEELGVSQPTVRRAMKVAFPMRYEEDEADASESPDSGDGVDRSRVSDTTTDKGGGEPDGADTPDTDVSDSGDESTRTGGSSSVSGPSQDVAGPDGEEEAEAFEDVEQLVGDAEPPADPEPELDVDALASTLRDVRGDADDALAGLPPELEGVREHVVAARDGVAEALEVLGDA